MGTHVFELPFRHPPSANVLIGENVARLAEQRRRPEVGAMLIGAVRSATVRRAIQHDRIGLRPILRHINGRKQPRAITHRYVELMLRIVLADVLQSLSHRSRRQSRHPTQSHHPGETDHGALRQR